MQRMTKQRLSVLSELERSPLFRSAQQLYDDLRSSEQSIGLATVYRNLQVMADEGLIDVLRAEDGEQLYRSCRKQTHHHHLVCTNCGRAENLVLDGFESWIQKVGAEHGFTQVTHTMELFGLCAACTTKNSFTDNSPAVDYPQHSLADTSAS